MNRCSVALLASAFAALALPSARAAAQSENEDASGSAAWELTVAPFAVHWQNEERHRHVVLLGLERGEWDGSLWGLSAFRNSFGQPCAYAYYGHSWDGLLGQQATYLKLSGGLIYGYKGPHASKVPFNHHGFGLAVIPAVGYHLGPHDAVQVGVLGTAALIFTYNHRF